MKTVDQIKPNFGPVYTAALYPELAKLCQSHGYALAVHGSLARDFDLVAIPWIEHPDPFEDVLKHITEEFAITVIGDPGLKPHGRVAHTLSIGFGSCSADISVMPTLKEVEG